MYMYISDLLQMETHAKTIRNPQSGPLTQSVAIRNPSMNM